MTRQNLPKPAPQYENFTLEDELVQILNGKTITTSLFISKYFKKDHDKVTRAIRTLAVQEPDFHTANFGEMIYIVSAGKGATREETYYTLTRDAFMMIVMSYTGEKARKIKIAFLTAFNHMEAILANSGRMSRSVQRPEHPQGYTIVIQFTNELVEFNGNTITPCAAAYETFSMWCAQRKIKPVTASAFGRCLYSLGISKARTKTGAKAYAGIAIKKPYIIHQAGNEALIAARTKQYTAPGLYILESATGIREVLRCIQSLKTGNISFSPYLNEQLDGCNMPALPGDETDPETFNRHLVARVDAALKLS